MKLEVAADSERGLCPGVEERGLVGIAGGEPLAPCGLFEGVSRGLGAPEVGVGAGLVDEVPGDERDGVEALGDAGDVFACACQATGSR